MVRIGLKLQSKRNPFNGITMVAVGGYLQTIIKNEQRTVIGSFALGMGSQGQVMALSPIITYSWRIPLTGLDSSNQRKD